MHTQDNIQEDMIGLSVYVDAVQNMAPHFLPDGPYQIRILRLICLREVFLFWSFI